MTLESRPMFGDMVVVPDVTGAFANQVIESYETRPEEDFSLALSGGRTARACYERLAQDCGDQID
ncbi:MAG: hypothetical protein NVSMB4_20950 [Acidimicrobiales bacterium]